MRDLSDIVKLRVKFWKRTGFKIVNAILKRVKNLRNYKNQKFAALSDQYAKYKANDMRTFTDREYLDPRLGSRPAGSRLVGYKGVSIASKKPVANMTLTGEMLDNLDLKSADAVSAVIGWDGQYAQQVQYLHDTKNYQIVGLSGGKVLADDEEKLLADLVAEEYGKNIDDWAKQNIVITLGKK